MTITNSNTGKPEQRRSVRVVQSACGCATLLPDKKTHAPVPGNKKPMSFEEAQRRLHKELGIASTTTIQAPAPVTHATKPTARPLGSRGLPEGLEKYRADHPMTFAEAQRRLKKEMGISIGRGFQAPAPVAAPVAHAAKREPVRPMGSKGLPEGLEQYRADHPMTFAEAQRRLKKEIGIHL